MRAFRARINRKRLDRVSVHEIREGNGTVAIVKRGSTSVFICRTDSDMCRIRADKCNGRRCRVWRCGFLGRETFRLKDEIIKRRIGLLRNRENDAEGAVRLFRDMPRARNRRREGDEDFRRGAYERIFDKRERVPRKDGSASGGRRTVFALGRDEIPEDERLELSETLLDEDAKFGESARKGRCGKLRETGRGSGRDGTALEFFNALLERHDARRKFLLLERQRLHAC